MSEELSQVSLVDAVIRLDNILESLGQAGVLRRPSVFPFYFELDVLDSTNPTKNFPEMQNTQLEEFNIESDGQVEIKSNLFRLLSGSQNLNLNGSFGLQIPTGKVFPIDFVPRIQITNSSGTTRKFAFYGWLAPLDRSFKR